MSCYLFDKHSSHFYFKFWFWKGNLKSGPQCFDMLRICKLDSPAAPVGDSCLGMVIDETLGYVLIWLDTKWHPNGASEVILLIMCFREIFSLTHSLRQLARSSIVTPSSVIKLDTDVILQLMSIQWQLDFSTSPCSISHFVANCPPRPVGSHDALHQFDVLSVVGFHKNLNVAFTNVGFNS